MAKVLSFKKYPDLLCNHEGAQFVNIGYSMGTLANDAPYEAELWYDNEGLYMGIVMPYMESFGKMNTEPKPKQALPKVINLRKAKEALEEENAGESDFSILCSGMVDEGEETNIETVKNYVDMLEDNSVVLYVGEEHFGSMKYRTNVSGNGVVEIMLVLKRGDTIFAIPSDEFKEFPNSCTTYDYRKVLGLDEFDEENNENKMTNTKQNLPFTTIKYNYHGDAPEYETDVIGFHLPSEEYGFFSNWFFAPFEYAGITFSSTEQFMMYHKVLMAKNTSLAKQIMSTDNPKEIKELASAKYFHEFPVIANIWDKNSYTIMKRGIRSKFMFHPSLMNELLRTANAILVECAKSDKIWACGISLHDNYKKISNWTGENRLGRILMELRAEFKLMQATNKCMDYIDAKDMEPIVEWLMRPDELARIPHFYNTIRAYTDTLSPEQKHHLYGMHWTLAGLDGLMRNNKGGGYNIFGFYEMKQDIYDIARIYCY